MSTKSQSFDLFSFTSNQQHFYNIIRFQSIITMDSDKSSTTSPTKESKKDVVNIYKSKKGRILPASTRAVVYSVLQFALKEKQAKAPIMDIKKAMERAAAMTGLSRDTVLKIKKEGSTNGGMWETPKKRPRPKIKTILNDADKMVVLNKIDEFERRNEAISIRKLLIILKQEINFAGGKDSLRRVLLSMGYKWEKNQSNKKVLRKTDGDNPAPVQMNTNNKPTEDYPIDNTNSMPLSTMTEGSMDHSLNMTHRMLQSHGALQHSTPQQQHQMPPHSHSQNQGSFIHRPLFLQAPSYIFNL